jgi:hypothetical protein
VTLTSLPAPSVGERAPRRPRDPQRIAAGVSLGILAILAAVALARIDISITGMFESGGNAQRFFARVGGLSFPEPLELLQLTVLTVGLVLTGTVLAPPGAVSPGSSACSPAHFPMSCWPWSSCSCSRSARSPASSRSASTRSA